MGRRFRIRDGRMNFWWGNASFTGKGKCAAPYSNGGEDAARVLSILDLSVIDSARRIAPPNKDIDMIDDESGRNRKYDPNWRDLSNRFGTSKIGGGLGRG